MVLYVNYIDVWVCVRVSTLHLFPILHKSIVCPITILVYTYQFVYPISENRFFLDYVLWFIIIVFYFILRYYNYKSEIS